MLIDWFTVVAQVLNFLILVWLLKRFLYKPILRAIDEREKRIAEELADAAEKEAKAQKERDEFQRKNDEIEQKRAVMLSDAVADAIAERERLFDQARKAAAEFSARRLEALRSEAQRLTHAIRRQTQDEVIAIARKVLADLADASLEERIVDLFVRRLSELNGHERQALAGALGAGASESPIKVRTALDLPPAQRARALSAVKEAIGPGAEVRFEIAPQVISGIEVTANGHRVSWNVADYLSSLEQKVADLLKQKGEPEVNVEQASQQ